MLDIKLIRENPDVVRDSLKKRGMNFAIDKLLEIDSKRKNQNKIVMWGRTEQNDFAERIPKLQGEERSNEIEKSRAAKAELQADEEKLKLLENKYLELMNRLPNILSDDVPVGKDETQNVPMRRWPSNEPPWIHFPYQDHMELGKELDIIDTEKAAEVTGARFGYLKGGAALLELALLQFTFQTLTSPEKVKEITQKIAPDFPATPFIPVFPPVMIRPEIFKKMARLTDEDKDERYYLQQDDLYLVGSAEHTLGPLHMDEIIPAEKLPIRYLGFSTSFRREAGSYGKDVKGILRMHQFDKIEMESFTLPELSIREHDFFVAVQEHLLQALKLPYQVMMICTGDIGKPDARQIDIETWMPGQKKYRETHTADLMTDYQARRLNTRFRRGEGPTEFVHMVDGTAFAIGRTIIAILENYQQADGSVRIPDVLRPYMGGMTEITNNESRITNHE